VPPQPAYDNLKPIPGRAGQLRFDASECFVDEAEGHKAQITLIGVLFRRCTIEHTADVLPAERLWAVHRGKGDLRGVLETVGILQHLDANKRREPKDAAEAIASVNLAEMYDFQKASAAGAGIGDQKPSRPRRTRS
jgi:hypothetical protein